jgi:hypothetical protein
MVNNFRTCEISRSAHKLTQTFTLIKKRNSLRYQAFEKAFKQEKNTQLPGFITKFYPKLDQIQEGLNQEKTHQFKK